MKSSVILLGAVMSLIKPFAPQRCPVAWARPRRRLPWLQFSSSLWSMQSKTSSQRQRRGMQCARFRQRNSSSRHSFTQPICQEEEEATGIKAFHPFTGATPEYFLMFKWLSGCCGVGKKNVLMNVAERGRGADLIRAVQAVVMSVTSQAGWHTSSAGTHVLVDRTCGENWKGSRSQSAGRVKGFWFFLKVCVASQKTLRVLQSGFMR